MDHQSQNDGSTQAEWQTTVWLLHNTRACSMAPRLVVSHVDSHLHTDQNTNFFHTRRFNAVGDGRLRPQDRHLANSTKHTCRLFILHIRSIIWKNDIIQKPEVRNISHCRQRRIEPRPRVIVCWHIRVNRQTHRHADHNTPHPYRSQVTTDKTVELRLSGMHDEDYWLWTDWPVGDGGAGAIASV